VIEFWIAYFQHAKVAVGVLYALFSVFTVIKTIIQTDDNSLKRDDAWKRFGKLFAWAIPIFLLAATPNINDIWEARIALIKYQLASPENIQKGVDKIQEISTKLECKYLGCKEKETK